MSTEILEIVQQMDLHNAETQLALQCAPLIAGVKISNLLVVSTGMEDAVKQCLRKSGISFLLLLRTREKARYLLSVGRYTNAEIATTVGYPNE